MLSVGGDFQQDFFHLFNLPARFQIDTAQLEQNFRSLQAQVHPDKFSHLSEAERRLSMQWRRESTRAIRPCATLCIARATCWRGRE